MSVLIKNKETGEWTDVAGGGGAGEVTKKYVDDQDQSMLTDSKSYTDAKKDEITEAYKKADEATLDAAYLRVQNTAGALETVLTKSMEDKDKVIADKVTALETTVGDSTKGLVKDVASLKTTVGDSSKGLVKTVADLPSYIRNQNVLSDWEALPGNVADEFVYAFLAAYDGFAVLTALGVTDNSTEVGTVQMTVYKGLYSSAGKVEIAEAVANTPAKGAKIGDSHVSNAPKVCVTIPIVKGNYYSARAFRLKSNTYPSGDPARAEYVSGKICYYKQRDYTGR